MRTFANSPRLNLRAWTASDASAAFEFYSDPMVSRFIGNGQPATDISHIQTMLAKFVAHQEKFGFSPWAVVDTQSSQVIGICGLHTYNEAQEPELGFRIHRSHWGKGIASEACRLALAYGFKEVGVSTVSALTHSDNKACQAVLVKVGFSFVRRIVLEGQTLLRFEIGKERTLKNNPPTTSRPA